MPEYLQKPLLLTLAMMLLGATTANAADDERWYRVELLVISQGEEQPSEQFEPQPTLGYPDAFRFLLQPDQLQKSQNEQDARGNATSVELDEFGRIVISMPAETTSTDIPPPPQPYEPQNDAPAITATTELTLSDEDLPPPRPTAFIALPDDIRELNTAANSLARSGRYEVLFHQSWNQPVAEKGQALPIVLDSSGDARQWSTLQGSILLHRSRYLHIETNLWRNTDGRYLHRQWRMAPAPLGPPSVIIERPAPLDIAEAADLSATAFIEKTMPPTAATADTMFEETTFAGTIGDVMPDNEVLDAQLSLEPVYPYRHAVLMQQKRRMRSNEVHYIDHPMLGLVIKITPLTEEDLIIQAELEDQLWPHVKQALAHSRDRAVGEIRELATELPAELPIN